MLALIILCAIGADPEAKSAVEVYADFERSRIAATDGYIQDAKAQLKKARSKAQREKVEEQIAGLKERRGKLHDSYLLLHDHKIGSCGRMGVSDTLSVVRIIDDNSMVAEWKYEGLGYNGRRGAIRTKLVFVVAPTAGLADESKLDKSWHYAITRTQMEGEATYFCLERVEAADVLAKLPAPEDKPADKAKPKRKN